MLKVESDKSISILTKCTGSKKNLLYAFLIALSLHAIGFGVFHIRPFLIPETQWTFPPVSVDSSVKLSSPGNITSTNETIRMPKTLLIPKSSIPDIDVKLKSQLPQVDLRVSLNPIKVRLLGTLAEKTKLQEPLQNAISLASSNVSQKKILYQVNLSLAEGKIFWLEAIDSDLSTKEQGEIEKYLLNTHFELSPHDVFVTGEIEVVYTQEKI